jgi:hypothetical protein
VQSHCQEALLAYFIIWQWGSGIRKKELDISIEHFLKTKFSMEVDFEVGDALEKLCSASLVYTRQAERSKAQLYFAVPPDEALPIVQKELLNAAMLHFS